mmetsp:Transcript_45155/g.79612  ORF Transcript_45155/g.79612 Transcript_45155/m.79612 type:complete len:86 (+) Transcript_45155:115-372(+)
MSGMLEMITADFTSHTFTRYPHRRRHRNGSASSFVRPPVSTNLSRIAINERGGSPFFITNSKLPGQGALSVLSALATRRAANAST